MPRKKSAIKISKPDSKTKTGLLGAILCMNSIGILIYLNNKNTK